MTRLSLSSRSIEGSARRAAEPAFSMAATPRENEMLGWERKPETAGSYGIGFQRVERSSLAQMTKAALARGFVVIPRDVLLEEPLGQRKTRGIVGGELSLGRDVIA